MKRLLDVLPQIISGYELRGKDALLSIVTPERAVNLCTHPSFERDATGWSTSGMSASAQSAEEQYSGAWSFKLTPSATTTAFVQYIVPSLVSGSTYTFSAYVLGAPGVPYSAYIDKDAVASPVENTTEFVGSGLWQRVWVSFTASSSGDYKFTIGKNGSTSLAPFYIDAVQIEASPYPTTYFDGDTPSAVPTLALYTWTGTPHASTSIRSAQARDGGRVVSLDAFDFTVLALRGLGMTPVYNASSPSGFQGGGMYQTSIVQQRVIQMLGRFDAESYPTLQAARQAFINAVSFMNTVPPQQFILRYQRTNCDGGNPGPVLNILCIYDGGLDGNTESYYSEIATPQFTMVNPLIQREQSAGIELTLSEDVTDADYILERSSAGVWQDMSGGLAGGLVESMVYGPDNQLYVVGNFTSAGGIANTSFIAVWNPASSTWSSITPTNANARIGCLAFGPDGALYVGGNFTTIDGVAANRIAKYDGGSWSALGTGLNNTCNDITIGFDGTLYATGLFTTAGGGAALKTASWNGATWADMDGGFAFGDGYAMATGLDGFIYTVGSFPNALQYWTGTAWVYPNGVFSGGSEIGADVAIGLDGRVYVTGNFESVDGDTRMSGVAYWDGNAWYPMGTGIDAAGEGFTLYIDPLTGMVYLGGTWTTINGLTTPDSAALWNGSTWVPLDVNLPGSAALTAVIVKPDGTLYLGYNTTGTAVASSALNSATNDGNANTYPKIVIDATGPLYSIRNVTTGAAVYFNLTLLSGERLTIDFNPVAIKVTSSFRGDVSGSILPGSQVSSFFLMPGENVISVFLEESAVVQAYMWWNPLYLSVDVP